MLYSFADLFWLFLIYSFAGWCIEVCYAAVRRKQFVNRGFISSPLCPIYGVGAVLFALFLPELKNNLFFLFLGGMLLASVLEYSVGMLMEKIFDKKLWDYSDIKYNIGGYVCLRYSLLWGALAVATILFSNAPLCRLLSLIPRPAVTVVFWILAAVLLLDFLSSAMSVLGMQIRVRRLASLSDELQHTSKLLENRLTRSVQKRMTKSFPAITRENLKNGAEKRKTQKNSPVFAEGCSFYKLVALFFIGAFLGDITETVFCLITTGRLMSRSSVVYGPFSIVWGLGCSLLTLFLYRYRGKNDRYIFLAGTLLGGAYEYICSVFTELAFGTVFWDYSGFAFNLGGRINLLYCFFWGIAAVVWLKGIYPLLSRWIERIPRRIGTILCNVLIVFMLVNMAVSSLALARYNERHAEPAGAEVSDLDRFLDSRFDDERMERIYPNAVMVE
ncbi:MAG: putative ABC transporter permease [Roseburia sp.]|nr:putative ABC transporter permease [Roseburia sp.]MCM1096601.1 putative ABC transporter permease [Ruminococcus flavefaciens]